MKISLKRNLQPVLLLISSAALALGLVNLLRPNDAKVIRYVRSQELIYGYKGMQEAMERFEAGNLQRKSSLDTLAADYRRTYQAYESGMGQLTSSEKAELEQRMQAQMEAYQQYSSRMEEEAVKEEKEMLEGVLVQINSYSEQYAQERGIDLILGTTQEGSILYGDKSLDITEELIQALNTQYQGE